MVPDRRNENDDGVISTGEAGHVITIEGDQDCSHAALVHRLDGALPVQRLHGGCSSSSGSSTTWVDSVKDLASLDVQVLYSVRDAKAVRRHLDQDEEHENSQEH